VNLQWQTPSGVEEESFDNLLAPLAHYSPALAAGPGSLSTAIALKAVGAEEALCIAVRGVRDALHATGIPVVGPTEINVVSDTGMKAQVAGPSLPRLVGIAEIARFLGVSRQRASELSRSSNFPHPMTRLAAGPVWLETSMVHFAKQWERMPGRPKR
jgi:hypothetical protein